MLASDHCDAVLAVVGSSAQFHPQLAVEPIIGAHPAKPLAVFIAPAADTSLDLLRAGGIPAFRTPESCADAIRCWFDWQPPVERAGVEPTSSIVIRSPALTRRVSPRPPWISALPAVTRTATRPSATRTTTFPAMQRTICFPAWRENPGAPAMTATHASPRINSATARSPAARSAVRSLSCTIVPSNISR